VTRDARRKDAAACGRFELGLGASDTRTSAGSRQALSDLERVLRDNPSVAVREVVTSSLKDLILTVSDSGGDGLTHARSRTAEAGAEVLKISTKARSAGASKNTNSSISTSTA